MVNVKITQVQKLGKFNMKRQCWSKFRLNSKVLVQYPSVFTKKVSINERLPRQPGKQLEKKIFRLETASKKRTPEPFFVCRLNICFIEFFILGPLPCLRLWQV